MPKFKIIEGSRKTASISNVVEEAPYHPLHHKIKIEEKHNHILIELSKIRVDENSPSNKMEIKLSYKNFYSLLSMFNYEKPI